MRVHFRYEFIEVGFRKDLELHVVPLFTFINNEIVDEISIIHPKLNIFIQCLTFSSPN